MPTSIRSARPKTSQGCELFDFSFVDPDNRRPVDYDIRKELLTQIIEFEKEGPDQLLRFLRSNRESGVEKLYTTWKLLNFRNAHPDIFTKGEYIPLSCKGEGPATLAFARHFGNEWVAIAAPLQSALKSQTSNNNHELQLPVNTTVEWVDILTNRAYCHSGSLPVADLCRDFGVALLFGSTEM